MPLSKWLIPPDQTVTPSEFRDYILELHNAVYGLGSDVTGTLDSSNVPSVANVHTQNKDQYLDQGGANETTVSNVKDAVTKKHDPGTNHSLLKQAVDPTDATASTVSVTSANADATYDAAEQALINELKGDLNQLVTDLNITVAKVNALMASMRTASLIA